MQVTPTAFTVAEYCGQMDTGAIVINREYQRSNRVWPPAARSYLIDTILMGYPMPKLCLYQKTDLKTRKTVKEIVDGQQRSEAIKDFYSDKLRISGKSLFANRKFSQLDERDQQQFISYQLTCDVFVGATDEEIRQVFRRMNSYTVPLNPQEKRHALYQGAFKWFIIDQVERFSQIFKNIGVFSEAQLSRMNDAALLTDICLTVIEGVQSASEVKLDALYRSRDEKFAEAVELDQRLTASCEQVLMWQQLHSTSLMKPYNFFTLILAVMHAQRPVPSLQSVFQIDDPLGLLGEAPLGNLSLLVDALENPDQHANVKEYIDACSKATNRVNQRRDRFKWISRAITQDYIG